MNGEIGFAQERDMPRLQEIWQGSFADSPEDYDGVALIFNKLLKAPNMLIMRVNGQAAATLTIQDFELTGQDAPVKAAYLYGVATAPEFRGRGYSTQLLKGVDLALKAAGYKAAVLVPASESLFGFYGKRGYETAFRINKASVMAAELPKSPAPALVPANAKALMNRREAAFGAEGLFARWPLGYLDYIAEECAFYGGGIYSVGESGICAACYLFGETLVVKELAGAAENAALAEVLGALKTHFSAAKRFLLYLREDIHTVYTNKLLPFGMIKWYDNNAKAKTKSAAYLTHALD